MPPASTPDKKISAQPLIWALTGSRAGDRAQILALAEALGWPCQEKRLRYNLCRILPNALLGASRISLDTAVSDTLSPPWPDLVIASGGRSAPIARWIARQAGPGCRLVHIGRPWAPLAPFDLVVTTPQYALPARPNVLVNPLTLNRVETGALMAAAQAWSPRLADLPEPRIALIVGGSARPFVFDAKTAEQLGRAASRLAEDEGASLLVTTSKRSDPEAVESLEAAITGPAYFHRWSEDGDNPYHGFLGLADSLVVTGDSASMLSEACATGKPVFIYPLPERPDWRLRAARFWQPAAEASGLWPRLYRRLVDLGLITSTRDMAAFHRLLLDRRLAARLGDPAPEPAAQALDSLGAAIERVRALFQEK